MSSIPMTKDLNYSDTLKRRDGHVRDNHGPVVNIHKAEYQTLLRLAHEYKSLREALVNGGVSPETLDVLIRTPIAAEHSGYGDEAANEEEARTRTQWSVEAAVFVPAPQPTHEQQSRHVPHKTWAPDPHSPTLSPDSYDFEDEKSSVTSSDKQDVADEYTEKQYKLYKNNHERRSLVLKGISNKTTLADVANVIRGGQLLNLYLRPRERTAQVTFVDPAAAEAFFTYSKRADLYICDKRVEVFWDEYQYYMPGHVAHKVATHGATRNLVLRFPQPDVTADMIREHLEHIHRLEVVEIKMSGGHIYISLNNVRNAAIARTCMSSRLKYKQGSRVEYAPDDCAQPLPPIAKKVNIPVASRAPAPKRNGVKTNRFHMLAADLGDDEEEEDKLEEVQRYEGFERSDWAGQAMSA